MCNLSSSPTRHKELITPLLCGYCKAENDVLHKDGQRSDDIESSLLTYKQKIGLPYMRLRVYCQD
jgi:hypothetical protein